MENKVQRLKTTNVENGKEKGSCCGRKLCTGSTMRPEIRTGTTPRLKDELIEQARNFFNEYYTSIKSLDHMWVTFELNFSCLLQFITGTLRKIMASEDPSDPHDSRQQTNFLLC
ncbi:hypothetical protein GQR58_025831 [Nymphon striatum]|nr:hypothetical protein GQR58_025831 [Nymphon striatum]